MKTALPSRLKFRLRSSDEGTAIYYFLMCQALREWESDAPDKQHMRENTKENLWKDWIQIWAEKTKIGMQTESNT